MFRKLFALAVALFFFAGSLVGAEYKGKLLKVDAEKSTITVVVGAKKGEKGQEKTFAVAKDAKIVSVKGKKGEQTEETLAEGLKNERFAKLGAKGGPGVSITTEGEGDKEVVKTFKVNAPAKKKKAK